jgi:hypothetical protein
MSLGKVCGYTCENAEKAGIYDGSVKGVIAV